MRRHDSTNQMSHNFITSEFSGMSDASVRRDGVS